MTCIDDLVRISSSLSDQWRHPLHWPNFDGLIGFDDLTSLLAKRNGLLAFEGALLLLPVQGVNGVPSLAEWNSLDGWRKEYGIPSGCLFFGMDVFACQFGLTSDGIIRFDPETGYVVKHSDSLESWAAKILDDYDYETGWSVARDWQLKNGPLPIDGRLLGKKPFVLGGEYTAENVACVPLCDAIQKLSGLYTQLKNVPDGAHVTLRGWL